MKRNCGERVFTFSLPSLPSPPGAPFTLQASKQIVSDWAVVLMRGTFVGRLANCAGNLPTAQITEGPQMGTSKSRASYCRRIVPARRRHFHIKKALL